VPHFSRTLREVGLVVCSAQNPALTSFSTVIELDASALAIIFSTYFATTSTSRFTGSPAPSDRKFVISAVCGIIATRTSVPSIAATVKLIPSIASDPLLTMYRVNSDGTLIVN